jgi:flagellar biosynthesis/type III secretory pathway protein FliH
MADSFIPLREFVLKAHEPEPEILDPIAPDDAEEPPCGQTQAREALAEVRRFRAAVYDAVDVAVQTVLRDIAAEVLARELELAPANIEAIVARACSRFASESIVCVRVHPDEAVQLRNAGVDAIADPALRRGDAVLRVRSGTIDVSLGARLAAVLDGAAS